MITTISTGTTWTAFLTEFPNVKANGATQAEAVLALCHALNLIAGPSAAK